MVEKDKIIRDLRLKLVHIQLDRDIEKLNISLRAYRLGFDILSRDLLRQGYQVKRVVKLITHKCKQRKEIEDERA